MGVKIEKTDKKQQHNGLKQVQSYKTRTTLTEVITTKEHRQQENMIYVVKSLLFATFITASFAMKCGTLSEEDWNKMLDENGSEDGEHLSPGDKYYDYNLNRCLKKAGMHNKYNANNLKKLLPMKRCSVIGLMKFRLGLIKKKDAESVRKQIRSAKQKARVQKERTNIGIFLSSPRDKVKKRLKYCCENAIILAKHSVYTKYESLLPKFRDMLVNCMKETAYDFESTTFKFDLSGEFEASIRSFFRDGIERQRELHHRHRSIGSKPRVLPQVRCRIVPSQIWRHCKYADDIRHLKKKEKVDCFIALAGGYIDWRDCFDECELVFSFKGAKVDFEQTLDLLELKW